MKNNEISNIPHKQPGKCPVSVIINKTDEGNQMTVAIPSNGEKVPSVEQYYGIMQKLTATQDKELAKDICSRATEAMPPDQSNAHNINTINQALSDMEPQDSVEAKLCLQSHVLYAQGMDYLNKAERAKMMCHSEFYMKNAMKLLRLHNETIEALSRYKRKGEQKVIVQHVNVENGGKAIVGNMIAEGRG